MRWLFIIFVLINTQQLYAQVHEVAGKVVLKYRTPDKIPDATRTDILYLAAYDPHKHLFYHEGNRDPYFSTAHTAPVIALVDASGKPFFARPRQNFFEVNYLTNEFNRGETRHLKNIKFLGWDGKAYSISHASFPGPPLLDKFPMTVAPNCNRISGEAWRSCGEIKVTADGMIEGKIKTSNNNFLKGFTGAVKLTFRDDKGNTIYEVITPGYGQDRDGERTDDFKTQIENVEILPLTHTISAEGIHARTNRTRNEVFKRITDYGKQLVISYLTGGG
ncbi:hypothetical protein [Lewinella sp. JB7]|uniref:hypothetical protein n=1 Tax=Lewinella sp. JB7 TaxID=2962887 RepID=UPI0020C95D3C|nr:hypothetical protein [Lewinella sp. JB7]MCP9237895.1 hypothetical protein [Lewinella sp. JB7]